MLPDLADYVNVIEFECRIAHHLPSRGDCRRRIMRWYFGPLLQCRRDAPAAQAGEQPLLDDQHRDFVSDLLFLPKINFDPPERSHT